MPSEPSEPTVPSEPAKPTGQLERDAADELDGSSPFDAAHPGPEQPLPPLRIVLFSRTIGFRHTSIEPAQKALASWLDSASYTLRTTEDAGELIKRLPESDVVVFLMTTGDVLDAAQQDAIEHFVRDGGGFVGVHSAADTEYDWPFYGELIVAWFESHPVVQEARVVVQAAGNPVVSFLPKPWQHRDEWYNFRINPRGRAEILLSVDEASYEGGTMGKDHPIAWRREVGRGRALYTALGHPDEAWQESALLQHVEAALRWAGHRVDAAPTLMSDD